MKFLNLISLHLVEISPLPLLCAKAMFLLLWGKVIWWHYNFNINILLGLFCMMFISFLWWSKISNESMMGFHTEIVAYGLRFGVILFILSEMMFFFSFFWGFFHKLLYSAKEMGNKWPPYLFSKMIIDPFSLPLLNTILLLSSGASITWCHHSMTENLSYVKISFLMTMILGFLFLYCQGMEFIKALFSLKFNIYSSVFFLLTGFHGLHVTMGVIFIFVCFIRNKNNHFSNDHCVGFEASAWYWHFVDVVWLFLFIFVYWFSFPM